MPEIGRSIVQQEGVALIAEYIEKCKLISIADGKFI